MGDVVLWSTVGVTAALFVYLTVALLKPEWFA
jgi:K+-transporting ATPase KdpF subunit